MSQRTLRSVQTEMSAVAMVIPAEGPSLGMAPSGMWMWKSFCGEDLDVDPELRGVGPGIAQGGLGRFLHDVAQRAGQEQPALALHLRRLDEQDLAARLGPGHAGGHADLVLLQDLVLENPGGPR